MEAPTELEQGRHPRRKGAGVAELSVAPGTAGEGGAGFKPGEKEEKERLVAMNAQRKKADVW